MTNNDDIDHFFAMLEDHDVDLAGGNTHTDVPVLTYRWSRNETVADCPLRSLLEAGEQVMQELGLKRIISKEHHLRGDTETGQRVKMTVLHSGQNSMYLLMTAGMPGTREEAKAINSRIAQGIEQLARAWKQQGRWND